MKTYKERLHRNWRWRRRAIYLAVSLVLIINGAALAWRLYEGISIDVFATLATTLLLNVVVALFVMGVQYAAGETTVRRAGAASPGGDYAANPFRDDDYKPEAATKLLVRKVSFLLVILACLANGVILLSYLNEASFVDRIVAAALLFDLVALPSFAWLFYHLGKREMDGTLRYLLEP